TLRADQRARLPRRHGCLRAACSCSLSSQPWPSAQAGTRVSGDARAKESTRSADVNRFAASQRPAGWAPSGDDVIRERCSFVTWFDHEAELPSTFLHAADGKGEERSQRAGGLAYSSTR